MKTCKCKINRPNHMRKKPIQAYMVIDSDWTLRGDGIMNRQPGSDPQKLALNKICKSSLPEGFKVYRKLKDCTCEIRYACDVIILEVLAFGEMRDYKGVAYVNTVFPVRTISPFAALRLVNDGVANAGRNNKGNYNTGSNNIGDYNSSDANVGDYNSGRGNRGRYNNGQNNMNMIDMIMNMENWRGTVAGKDDWVVEKVGIENEAEIFDFIKENGYNTPEIRHAIIRSLQHRACYIVAADMLLGILCLEITGELAANVIIVTPHERRRNIAADMLKAVARDGTNNAYKYLILKNVSEDAALAFRRAVGAEEIPV